LGQGFWTPVFTGVTTFYACFNNGQSKKEVALMKQLMKRVVCGTSLVALFLMSGPWGFGSELRGGMRSEGGSLRQVALSSEERKQEQFITRIEESQDEIVEIVQGNTLNLFEQMDRLGQIQQELGSVIRDHASLKLSVADKIESVRAGLDEVMIRSTTFQLKVSQRVGRGQEEMGVAIVASQRFPEGTIAFQIAQEQLGRAILENSVRQRRAAEELGRDQEVLGLAIRDHASFLAKASEEVGRSEERLGQTILLQAKILFATNEAIEAGKQRLHLAILEGDRIEVNAMKQLGRIE
jgi:hypothetical protein